MIENINKRFAIIGIAGYIALRHLKAIKSLGQNVGQPMIYLTASV